MTKDFRSTFSKLQFNKGISLDQIDKLIKYSKSDELILKFTSDNKRFKSKSAFDKWYKKGRVVYTLSDASDTLLGIIWFGRKKIPLVKKLTSNVERTHFGMTFAIRMYGIARGKGLSTLFMKKAYSDFIRSDIYKDTPNKGFWLETYMHNTPAISAYKTFGYKIASDIDHKNRIIMVLDR